MKLQAKLPLYPEVFRLSKVFKQAGYELMVVGGAVRDFLMMGESFEPKDIDLATNANPEQVKSILDAAGLVNRPQGESFGVWIARVGFMEFEIATFREDGEYSDGRRPDSVVFSTAEKDYARRDLTINGLFYDIPEEEDVIGEIIDFGGGIGFEDVKNQVVRTIGEPMDRFAEDKLRVARAVRFHCRYNKSPISVLGDKMLEAIHHFRDLRKHGVSGPRIHQEFLAGFKQSIKTSDYLKAYHDLRLMPAVFGDLEVCMKDIDALENCKNIVVVLAWLFRKHEDVRDHLNSLNWPNDVVDGVQYLLNVLHDEDNRSGLSLRLDIHKNRENVSAFSYLMDCPSWNHFKGYRPPIVSGEWVMEKYNLKPGPEIGRIQREIVRDDYNSSLANFCR